MIQQCHQTRFSALIELSLVRRVIDNRNLKIRQFQLKVTTVKEINKWGRRVTLQRCKEHLLRR